MVLRSSFFFKLVSFVNKIPGIVIIFFGIFWKIFIDCLVILSFSTSLSPDSSADSIDYYRVIIAICFAPIFETLFYQVIPIELFERISLRITHQKYPLFAALFSAVLFGLAHTASIYQCLATCITGLALSGTYLIFKHRRHSILFGAKQTALLHFLVNVLVQFFRYVL